MLASSSLAPSVSESTFVRNLAKLVDQSFSPHREQVVQGFTSILLPELAFFLLGLEKSTDLLSFSAYDMHNNILILV